MDKNIMELKMVAAHVDQALPHAGNCTLEDARLLRAFSDLVLVQADIKAYLEEYEIG